MDHLSERLIEKAEYVLNVSPLSDKHITTPDRKYVLDLIAKTDLAFATKMRARPNFSFVFGDKYFSPHLKENYLFLCIPYNCSDPEAELIKLLPSTKNKMVVGEIMSDFEYMTDTYKPSGHFDIS